MSPWVPGPSNPDRDAWLAQARDRMRRQRDELLARPPFPVYGLASPALRPFALADLDRDDAQWHSVLLCFGDPAGVAGPYVSVRTSSPRDHVPRRHADQVLHAALSEEHARIRLPDQPGPATLGEARIRLDLQPRRARLGAQGDVWAARTSASRLDVLAVGRGVRFTDVTLVVVEDLAPYWHGREEMFGLPFGH